MLFNSTQFLVFFPVVVVLYYLLPQCLKNIGCLLQAITSICAGMPGMPSCFSFQQP